MTYFRTGNPYYHRRAAVSRSCSRWEGVVPAGYGRQALRGERCSVLILRAWAGDWYWEGKGGVEAVSQAQSYGIKPHGRLVSVSLTHYCASTPDLSTWWSATALQGDLVPGRSHLQARFPLRCFQRLSFPYIATQRCLWRDNWYTSGTSTPVLSY